MTFNLLACISELLLCTVARLDQIKHLEMLLLLTEKGRSKLPLTVAEMNRPQLLNFVFASESPRELIEKTDCSDLSPEFLTQ